MNAINQKELREKIRDLSKTGLTVSGIAKGSNVPQSSLSKFMNGKTILFSTAEKLITYVSQVTGAHTGTQQASGE